MERSQRPVRSRRRGGKSAHGLLVDAPDGKSEHPPDGPHPKPVVGPGTTWTTERVNAIAETTTWPRSAVFITWDDWGGWYDHVEAPHNSTWRGGPPAYHDTQFRYGNRVPCLVVSPYAREGVIHRQYSHASVVKFCLRAFGLPPWDTPALAAGDPSGDMWECFDFEAPPRQATPRAELR